MERINYKREGEHLGRCLLFFFGSVGVALGGGAEIHRHIANGVEPGDGIVELVEADAIEIG